MSVISNYLAVIFIWSTTPLAIHFGHDGLSAHAAVMLRMLLAFILAAVFIAVWQHKSTLKRHSWKLYIVAGVALFPAMPLVYLASNTISSGLVSVMFALTPISSGLLAAFILRERFWSPSKAIALLLAISGLFVIYKEQMALKPEAITGIGLMLLSNLFFSSSQVMTKYLHNQRQEQGEVAVDAFEQTFGALTFAVPCLVLSWFIFDGQIPHELPNTSLISVVYLSVIGSLVGFVAYFVVLNNYSVAIVSLIPLITPALALWLGAYVLSEPVGLSLQLGSALIIAGLMAYDPSFMKYFMKGVDRVVVALK